MDLAWVDSKRKQAIICDVFEFFRLDYLGSEVGSLSGIEEYSKSYLGLESFEFNFSIAINSKEWYIDQIHILMMLSAQSYIENPNDTLNFSLYKRPPSLKNRPAGKMLAVVAGSILIGLAYPAYQFAYHSVLSIKAVKQTSDYWHAYSNDSSR